MSLACSAHYNLDTEYSKLIALSENAHNKLLEAKNLRCEKGGLHYHAEQTSLVPDKVDTNIHGIHMEPCYKRYTMIISKCKRKAPFSPTPQEMKRLRSPEMPSAITSQRTGVKLFPDYCFFCKKKRKKVKGKEQLAHKLTLKTSEDAIKEAALRKGDENLLVHIENENLLSKEFYIHDKCRKDYIRKDKDVIAMKDAGTSDFEKVKREINCSILSQQKAISIKVIHDLYNDGHSDDTRYRNKLKQRIVSEFGDTVCFMMVNRTSPEVIVSSEGVNSLTTSNEKLNIISEAARFLREDILEYAFQIQDTVWPPTTASLESRFETTPVSLLQFLESLLKNPDHASSEKVQRLVKSFSSDVIYAITQGKVLTLKHFLLGLGLHNMIGQKLPITILSRLGHCASYGTVTSIETAQAEINQLLYQEGTSEGLKPISENDFVFTYFWADNFNKKIESDTIGMIDSTHMIKFQEKTDSTIMQEINRNIPRSKTKFSMKPTISDSGEIRANPKIEPRKFSHTPLECVEGNEVYELTNFHYFLWLVIRSKTANEKLFPNFAGWRLLVRKFKEVAFSKTVVTYLPPINASVTSFSTIYQYLEYMQKLCREANMPFVNVTLDCGAAINAFKLVWNYLDIFNNVIIHLGDFHCMGAIFDVLGLIVKGSGFEEIVFQSGLSTSGSLNGVIAGSHYNRCWKVHESFSEALELLLYERFLDDTSITDNVARNQIMEASEGNDYTLLSDTSSSDMMKEFTKYKQRARLGEMGKTAQFWLINYIDIVHILHIFHISIQEGSYYLRLKAWLEMLPYFFGLNRTNYSRYGSYYVCQMLNLDKMFPGCKELLVTYGISVQGQDKYPLRTSIDQRGEQTFNRDAKTSGGITNCAGNIEMVTKWTLNRSSQAKIANELKEFAGVNDSDYRYKPLQPSNVVKSNNMTTNLVEMIADEFINPFGKDLETTKLYNLSSGIPVDDSSSDGMLAIFENGKNSFELFVNERLLSNEKNFHATLPRLSLKLFSQSGRKVIIQVNGKTKILEANSNIISTLLAVSTRMNRVIDFKEALKFPLTSVPLNISHPDGSRRTTQKSKLTEIIVKKSYFDRSAPYAS